MIENQYVGFDKTGVAYAEWKDGILFICSDGTYLWSNDNLLTVKTFKKEMYRGQIIKRMIGTFYRLSIVGVKQLKHEKAMFKI